MDGQLSQQLEKKKKRVINLSKCCRTHSVGKTGSSGACCSIMSQQKLPLLMRSDDAMFDQERKEIPNPFSSFFCPFDDWIERKPGSCDDITVLTL